MVIIFTKHLLNQKNHLSKIWLAAHWEKKIRRTQIFEVDIVKSVQEILEADITLDLRISGHLLVGIVKIHSKKAKYLLTECSTIFYQVKIYRTCLIDLPEDEQTASVNEITLKEYLDDTFKDVENDIVDAICTSHQSRLEDITLKETTTERLTLLDDDMTNFEFHEEDEPFEFPENILSDCNDLEVPKTATIEQPVTAVVERRKGVTIYQSFMISLQEAHHNIEKSDEEISAELQNDFSIGSFGPEDLINEIPESLDLDCLLNGNLDQAFSGSDVIPNARENREQLKDLELEPLDVSTKTGTRSKFRKKKTCIDYVKKLSKKDIEKQVLDTSDIVSTFDLAPTNKRLMTLKEIGSAEKLLQLPFLKMQNKKLLKVYERNLKTCPCDDFDSISGEDERNSELEMQRRKSKRLESEKPPVFQNFSPDLNESPALNIGGISNFNADNEFPGYVDNIMDNAVFENQLPENLWIENLLSSSQQMGSINDTQATPVSKTSTEKCEYVLKGRITHVLTNLKDSFKTKTTVPFSSIAKKNRRLWVAQTFYSLLLMKKCGAISLEQSDSYDEIFISGGSNFETAHSNFCNV